MDQMEFIRPLQVFMGMSFREFIPSDDRGCNDQVGTGFIERNRIERSQNSQIRNNSSIIVIPAITLGGYVHDKADVEMRFVL